MEHYHGNDEIKKNYKTIATTTTTTIEAIKSLPQLLLLLLQSLSLFLLIIPQMRVIDANCEPSRNTIIDGKCCAKNSYLDENSECRCEMNRIVVFDAESGESKCECPSTMIWSNLKQQCVIRSTLLLSRDCECPINSEIMEEIMDDDDVDGSFLRRFCRCKGDLVMKNVGEGDAKRMCICEDEENYVQFGTKCCPKYSELSSDGELCECSGDLVMNSEKNRCECKSNLIEGTNHKPLNMVQYGTKCCRADQIETNGVCHCFLDMHINSDSSLPCVCSVENKQKCCDYISDPSMNQIFVYSETLKRCICSSLPSGTIHNMNFESSYLPHTCCSSIMKDTSDGISNNMCTCQVQDEYIVNMNNKECVCKGRNMQLVNGKCECKGDMILFEDNSNSNGLVCKCRPSYYLADNITNKCCRNDKIFDRDTQSCLCKDGFVDTNINDFFHNDEGNIDIDDDSNLRCQCPSPLTYNPLNDRCECQLPYSEVNGKCLCENEGILSNGEIVCCDSVFEIFDVYSEKCVHCQDRFILRRGECHKCAPGFQRNKRDITQCVATKYAKISAILAFLLLTLIYVLISMAFTL